jgi:hypothetical protein
MLLQEVSEAKFTYRKNQPNVALGYLLHSLDIEKQLGQIHGSKDISLSGTMLNICAILS